MNGTRHQNRRWYMPHLPLMNPVAIQLTGSVCDDQISRANGLRLIDSKDICLKISAFNAIPPRFRPGRNIADNQAFLQMKLPRATVVEEAVCHIRFLLYLRQGDACADSMYRSGGDEPGFPRDGR